jgi:hypothetical protein
MTGANSRSADAQPQLRRASFFRVLQVPIVLALVTASGLASALLGDDLWDVSSWLALSIPISVIVWHVAREIFSRTRARM